MVLRGWFYTTYNVDVGIKSLKLYEIDTKNPDIEKPIQKTKRDELNAKDLIDIRNKSLPKAVNKNKKLLDFYNKYDPLDVTDADRREYNKWIKEPDSEELNCYPSEKNFMSSSLKMLGALFHQ